MHQKQNPSGKLPFFGHRLFIWWIRTVETGASGARRGGCGNYRANLPEIQKAWERKNPLRNRAWRLTPLSFLNGCPLLPRALLLSAPVQIAKKITDMEQRLTLARAGLTQVYHSNVRPGGASHREHIV
jgi:hypothetical protein